MLQTILKDVCYENIDCILKLLDESGAENSTVVVLKKTERSFKGKCCIAVVLLPLTMILHIPRVD